MLQKRQKEALRFISFITNARISECDPENTNSWRLLEALGFTREAFLRQNVYFWKDENENPIWKDTYIYGLLNN